MSKYNRAVTPAVASPVKTEAVPSGVTFEGAPGYARDPKSELFLLAVAHMGAKSFYESEAGRDRRFTGLVAEVAVADPEWTARFVPWLRDSANMRTASVVAVAEALRALQAAGKPGGRQIVASALKRADEPGELLAYWMTRYGRKLPVALNRGISDALKSLYTEFAFLKYDSRESALRFGDVVELVNPRYHLKEYGTWRDALWRHAIESRHGRGNDVPESLPMIRANIALRKTAAEDPSALLDPAALRAAGMTWEDALSLAGAKVSKRDLWTSLIPSMGYMALLRNLRNFDQAGVSDEVAQQVAARLADPEQVARSRQFPFRFLSAYRAVPSLRWSYPLEKALNASLASIPALKGRTLVLIDTSTSMNATLSGGDGTMLRWDAAVLFGAAVAQRCGQADVVSFSGRSYYHEPQAAKARAFPLRAGESLLRTLERWQGDGYFLGGGTDTALALKASFNGHDRVVIVTDEQAASNGTEVSAAVPSRVPLYTWNISGEKFGHAPSGSG
ncbi:MAG TPA: TROVE domain-containing protein, partial [Streptosporangiaceae bacterium]|nr:TROVE domain-containing protein [Streptosporangiaceae bacterium]